MKLKISFIINPVAGHARKVPYLEIISSIFNEQEYETDIGYTDLVSSASVLSQRAVERGCDIIVAVGGDGTVNQVAGALRGKMCALGIIPSGSGNGLARHHRIPMDITAALGVIKRNNQVLHDAIRINEFTSFNVSGIGFDAHVAQLFGLNGKRGFSGYMKLVVREFHHYKNHTFEISDGMTQKSYEAALIAIANASQFGNNATISPEATTNDGITNITVVKKMSWLELPFFLAKVFKRKISNSSYAILLSGPKFFIRSETPVPLHIDGENAGKAQHFTIEIIPDAIRLIVP